MKKIVVHTIIGMLLLHAGMLHAQEKQVNYQWQTWVSLNTTFRLSKHWGVVGDVHVRRTNFIKDPSFYFVRAGGGYWINDQLSFIVGYAHLWLAPTTPGYTTYADENRLYEQILYTPQINKVSLLFRFRDEHRWREIIKNDTSTGQYAFTNRLRYLISVNIPVSGNPFVPQLSFANEIAIQFGKTVVNNTFEQLRLFGGIRQNLGKGWSFDAGYMLVYQQKSSGYQYDFNNTARLFFYYTWKAKNK